MYYNIKHLTGAPNIVLPSTNNDEYYKNNYEKPK